MLVWLLKYSFFLMNETLRPALRFLYRNLYRLLYINIFLMETRKRAKLEKNEFGVPLVFIEVILNLCDKY